MRYTLSALAIDEAIVRQLINALATRGIERSRVTITPQSSALNVRKQQQILVTVKTNDLVESERIVEALNCGGGRSVQSAEESSVLDAI